VTFGSIENASAPVSSTTITPVVKQEGVKSFGTVAVNIPSGHVNGKTSISSRSSVVSSGASSSTTSTTASSTATSTASLPAVATPSAPPDATSSKENLDVKKLFQNLQGTSSSDTSSPAARNTSLTQPSSSHHATAPLHNLAPINTLSRPTPLGKANTAGRMGLLGHLHFRDKCRMAPARAPKAAKVAAVCQVLSLDLTLSTIRRLVFLPLGCPCNLRCPCGLQRHPTGDQQVSA
jgi:hypothetical protein